ncbi:Retrovirus-related Pol polyprotein from transposon RE1 [Vitis vinifera]|uniref:Retrovirus-related Pol polyprotein from transposon RE1 n=1 Tax=Vitis vinifera TaxID=29760 RepID=A0A438FV09_VITVI|nr:Retrovirus-related Pol polyprotein from transposon RE1 [Vitis vinifera]
MGTLKRRHRHIVETGLSLLTHASMPLSYWPFAFSTAVYLINRLPTPTLNHLSPYFKLFGTFPNYSKLRSFGCSAILGFAHTHPTNSSLAPPLASLLGTLPLKVPIYVLTHPPSSIHFPSCPLC